MNKEIKEILELFAYTDENIMFGDIIELNSKQCHKILDFITNLQQKYEQADNDRHKLFEQKEKAMKYINKLSNEPNVFGHYGIDGNCKKYLLNILQGDDKDVKD